MADKSQSFAANSIALPTDAEFPMTAANGFISALPASINTRDGRGPYTA